jgi:hypothetical protein
MLEPKPKDPEDGGDGLKPQDKPMDKPEGKPDAKPDDLEKK